MTDHPDLHDVCEMAVIDALLATFPVEQGCRAAVLLAVLADEIEDMTDVEEVQDVMSAMSGIMLDRVMADRALFDTQGSA